MALSDNVAYTVNKFLNRIRGRTTKCHCYHDYIVRKGQCYYLV